MSHTSSSLHDVHAIEIQEVRHADEHRWQNIAITMNDGSTHTLTLFFEPGFSGIRVPTEPASRVTTDMVDRLRRGNEAPINGDIRKASDESHR